MGRLGSAVPPQRDVLPEEGIRGGMNWFRVSSIRCRVMSRSHEAASVMEG